MQIIRKLNEDQRKQLLGLYRNEWWAKDRTEEDIQRLFDHGCTCLGLADEQTGRLAAFCRFLSDGVFKAIVFDVIVHPDYRQSGLGRELMETLKNLEDLKRVRHLELYCLPEMEKFYERFGFSSLEGKLVYMRFARP